jgi:hypothetical protein
MRFNQFSVELDEDTIVIRQDNTCEMTDHEDTIAITLAQLDAFIKALNGTRDDA